MRDDPTYRAMTLEAIKEDEEILDALEQFEGGFFGGFEGVASEHRKVLERLRPAAIKESARRDGETGRRGRQQEGRGEDPAAVADSPKEAEAGAVQA